MKPSKGKSNVEMSNEGWRRFIISEVTLFILRNKNKKKIFPKERYLGLLVKNPGTRSISLSLSFSGGKRLNHLGFDAIISRGFT